MPQTCVPITSSVPDSAPWTLLSSMLPTADWTHASLEGQLTPAVDAIFDGHDTARFVNDCALPASGREDVYDAIARVLYRRQQRHVLITARQGTGKTAIVRELARRAAIGEVPFLKDRRFLWIDASNVGPEDSRACLETIAAAAAEPPSQPVSFDEDEDENLGETLGRILQTTFERALEEGNRKDSPNVVLCLDNFDSLLKRPNGGSNKPLLRAIRCSGRVTDAWRVPAAR